MNGEKIIELELKDTVAGMLSENYKDRLVAELQQAIIRRNKLYVLWDKWDYFELSKTCQKELIEKQIDVMNAYVDILTTRVVVELF